MLGFRRKRTNLHEKYDYPTVSNTLRPPSPACQVTAMQRSLDKSVDDSPLSAATAIHLPSAAGSSQSEPGAHPPK